MTKDLKKLVEKEYPGRLIIIGTESGGHRVIVVYAITGRSPSSQARKIEFLDQRFLVKPTDDSVLRTGNIDLLIYPAIVLSGGIAVSNGKQTEDIHAAVHGEKNAVHILEKSLETWEYEPDAPTYTPRISGCVLSSGSSALSILKRSSEGRVQRRYFDVPMIPGQGKMISTYSGENKDPLPSFEGDPEDVALPFVSAEDMAEAVYEALKPVEGVHPDFRVAVSWVYTHAEDLTSTSHSIINRIEREEIK